MRDVILIAEDEETDAILLERAIGKLADPVRLQLVRDGQEAIDYLRGAGIYSDREKYPMPALVLLDLKMPKKTGFEVLEWIRSESPCTAVPVIVWSSSKLPTDVKRAYDLRANCYLQKPNSFPAIQQLVEMTVGFWRMCERPASP